MSLYKAGVAMAAVHMNLSFLLIYLENKMLQLENSRPFVGRMVLGPKQCHVYITHSLKILGIFSGLSGAKISYV